MTVDGHILGSGESDVDVTAMALQALSNYTDNSEVSNCVNKAISFFIGKSK